MSLIRQYKFDQTDLTIDSTGNSSLNNYGAASSIVDATYGNVASFTGATNSYLGLTTTPSAIQGSSPRTFSLWVNRSSNTDTRNDTRILFANGEIPDRLQVYFSTFNRLVVNYHTGVIVVTDSFTTNVWYNIVVTYDGTTLSVYNNGVFLDSNSVVLTTSSSQLTIGFDITASTIYIFEGEMSDFRIYDGALDANEIASLYSDGPNAPGVNPDPIPQDPSPRDPPYSSVVLASSSQLAPLTSGTIVHGEKYQIITPSNESVSNSSYVNDSISGVSTEIARDEVTMSGDGSSAQLTMGVLQEDLSGVQTIQNIITTSPECTYVKSMDTTIDNVSNLKIDGGISWDKDDSSLYLGASKRFRFKYVPADSTNRSRLSIQAYNDTSLTYITKAEFFTS